MTTKTSGASSRFTSRRRTGSCRRRAPAPGRSRSSRRWQPMRRSCRRRRQPGSGLDVDLVLQRHRVPPHEHHRRRGGHSRPAAFSRDPCTPQGQRQFDVTFSNLVAGAFGLDEEARPGFSIPRGYWFSDAEIYNADSSRRGEDEFYVQGHGPRWGRRRVGTPYRLRHLPGSSPAPTPWPGCRTQASP